MQREGSCECGISISTEVIRVIGPIGPIAKTWTILNPERAVTRQTSLTCTPLAGAARRHSNTLA